MAPLEVKYHGIDAQFNETYDSAPPLPHPLKSEHALKHITGQGLLNESLSVAPLTKEEEDRVVEIGLGEVRATDYRRRLLGCQVLKYTNGGWGR